MDDDQDPIDQQLPSRPRRRLDYCASCKQWKELWARGMCNTCYRAKLRERQEYIDPHAVPRRKKASEAKLLKLHSTMEGVLIQLGVSEEEWQDIFQILEPYNRPIAHLLNRRAEISRPRSVEDEGQ
jgi:hypothetical protein